MNQLPKFFQFVRVLAALAFAFALMPQAAPVPAASPINTYTVTSTADSGAGTLRYAINQANINSGPDLINFSIGGCGAAVCTIAPLTPLPILTGDGTTIDGYTQTGAAPATGSGPATIKIEIDGTNLNPSNLLSSGLNITSTNNLVRGLAIIHCPINGITIGYADATGNLIQGNHIGVTPSAGLMMGNSGDGVFIGGGAADNTIGGKSPAERNIIGGNGWEGVGIHGVGSDRNIIIGNYIGTNGTNPLGNNLSGVRIYGGAKDNWVGGNEAVERNRISGNGLNGVHIAGLGTDGNQVHGNDIGVALSNAAMGNHSDGVYIGSGAQFNVVGGATPSTAGNLISANLENGLQITGTSTLSNTIANNIIGTFNSTLPDLGNEGFGVLIAGGAGNTLVGGDEALEGNSISGNGLSGVVISGDTASNIVSGNRIGVSSDGTSALGNGQQGVILASGAHHNRIGGVNTMPGGTCGGECNLISGNNLSGIVITSETTQNNEVLGNYVGTNSSGTAAIANGDNGILITSAKYNAIGGETPEVGNLISGNDENGIEIVRIVNYDAYNTISGNIIGLNASATSVLGNGLSGVLIDGSSHNLIGGQTSAGGNTISGNGEHGVMITNGSLSNELRFNRIGVSLSEMLALGNALHGVVVEGGSQQNIIGGANDTGGNVISANGGDGVRLTGTDTRLNQVLGNLIGSQPHTFTDLGNAGFGVSIISEASENTIAGHNWIVYNNAGVWISEDGTMDNIVSANWISDSDVGGVTIRNGAKTNTIGPGNIIRSNANDGVRISGADTFANVVTLNAIGENVADGINLEDGANQDIQAPTILAVVGSSISVEISGAACAGCIVEVFGNRGADGEGEFYLDSDVAGVDGSWSLVVDRLFYRYLTATATGVVDGTSEFSAAFANPYRYVFMPMMIR